MRSRGKTTLSFTLQVLVLDVVDECVYACIWLIQNVIHRICYLDYSFTDDRTKSNSEWYQVETNDIETNNFETNNLC